MTILVGVDPHDSELGSLALGAFLAASTGESLLVVTVVPIPRMPDSSPVDAQYRSYLGQLAQETLARAKAAAPSGADVSFMTVHARSVGSGLVQAARTAQARIIVVGSADAGVYGRISTGSVSARLLHSSPLPVAVSVRGDDRAGTARVERLSVAYGGAEDDPLLALSAREAQAMNVGLRLLFFALAPRPSPREGVAAGQAAAWSKRILASARRIPGLKASDLAVEILRGHDWREAVGSATWLPHEMLALGSSRGTSDRVFMGSRGAKIVRHAPVPVLALPGSRL